MAKSFLLPSMVRVYVRARAHSHVHASPFTHTSLGVFMCFGLLGHLNVVVGVFRPSI